MNKDAVIATVDRHIKNLEIWKCCIIYITDTLGLDFEPFFSYGKYDGERVRPDKRFSHCSSKKSAMGLIATLNAGSPCAGTVAGYRFYKALIERFDDVVRPSS